MYFDWTIRYPFSSLADCIAQVHVSVYSSYHGEMYELAYGRTIDLAPDVIC